MPSSGKFGVVDQALNTLKKVEQYIMAGMETTIDVSLDLVECDKESSEEKLSDLKSIMLRYASMERDLKQFTEAVESVKRQTDRIKADEEWPDMNQALDEKIKELQTGNNEAQLEDHEKYQELKQKIWDLLHPDELIPTQDVQVDPDDDFTMTQKDINIRCPYTGKEMVIPLKNRICGHHYDKEAVEQMFKTRKHVKCPIQGCINDKPMSLNDLEENKEMKKYIAMKNRQNKKKR